MIFIFNGVILINLYIKFINTGCIKYTQKHNLSISQSQLYSLNLKSLRIKNNVTAKKAIIGES